MHGSYISIKGLKIDLTGKTAIVTSGVRDIGRACVMRTAQAGACVVINYRNYSARADTAVLEIKSMGGKAIALQGDMTK